MENVVTVIFKVGSEAYQAFSELKSNMVTNDYTVSQVALFQKENGRLSVRENFDSGVNTTDDTGMGGLVGLLLGVWTGPIGMLLCSSAGALVGSLQDTKDAAEELSMLELVAEKIQDGDTALVLLASEEREAGLDTYFAKYGTEILRRDAAVVSKEVDDALELQKELAKEAKQKSRNAKKRALKADLEERRNKIKGAFEAFKAKFAKK